MLITRAEVEGRACAVRIEGGRIAEVGAELEPRTREAVFDATGGALLPGLHDHHLHLFAWAAARRSVACGPPAVRDVGALANALREAARAAKPGAWIRGVGYHESVAGPLDRRALDALVPDHPVRIQQRTGSLWCLNSAACRALGVDDATGRLFHADAWLRARLAADEAPSLTEVGRLLSQYGVTGVTDASLDNGAAELAAFVRAQVHGELPQRVIAMGGKDLPDSSAPRLARGARKLRLSESDLPRFEDLVAEIESAHAQGRAVAIHCVTRTELVFACAAFEAGGTRPGDRIEHASVAPPDSLAPLAALRLTVVTQPGFVATRGDAYRRDVDPSDLPYLYRCAGLVTAGIHLGGSTDAPYGDPDPWAAMRAAVDRLAPDGQPLGANEALSPERALALFTTPAESPGGAPRRIVRGAPADLCLLDRPWSAARRQLESRHVVATWCDGRLAWSADHGFARSCDSAGRAIPSAPC
ncbi:MAG TPA: amidohydrolase family protein [Myxococcota bacterium]|nr:amidohydrolase family protein [Myxococcota bacterium]